MDMCVQREKKEVWAQEKIKFSLFLLLLLFVRVESCGSEFPTTNFDFIVYSPPHQKKRKTIKIERKEIKINSIIENELKKVRTVIMSRLNSP